MDAIIARIRALTDADFLDHPGVVRGDSPVLRHWARTVIADNILVWRDQSAGSPLQIGQDGPAPNWWIERRSRVEGQEVIYDGYCATFYHSDGEDKELFIRVVVPNDGEMVLDAYARRDQEYDPAAEDDSNSDTDSEPDAEPDGGAAAAQAIVDGNNQMVANLLAHPNLPGLLANPGFLALLHSPGGAAILDGLVAAGINVPPAPQNDEDNIH